MCECCLVDAEDLGTPLPGVSFVRARKDGQEMKAGDYGLVFINSPFVTWQGEPKPDPFHGWSDELINACSPEEWDAYNQWADDSDAFGDQLMGKGRVLLPSTNEVWRLVEAGRKVGFDPELDGDFGHWLFNRLGLHLTGQLEETTVSVSDKTIIIEPEKPEQVNADPATPERVEGRRIVWEPTMPRESDPPGKPAYNWCWTAHGGSYGMGGPGFVGLHLEATDEYPAEWLMLCLWGADDWLTVNGRWLGAHPEQYEQQKPLASYYSPQWDEFGPMVEGGEILLFSVTRDECLIVVKTDADDPVEIRIDKDPSKRPVVMGTKEPRIVPPHDDLRNGAWKLVNEVGLWI